ncbi:MAG: trypsin-like peptidase domain-containing protein [Pseudomonadota bacterium]
MLSPGFQRWWPSGFRRCSTSCPPAVRQCRCRSPHSVRGAVASFTVAPAARIWPLKVLRTRCAAKGPGFINAPCGLIVTNHHVIEGAERIEVAVNDERRMDTTLVGTDPVTDIAPLRVEGAHDFWGVNSGSVDELTIGA